MKSDISHFSERLQNLQTALFLLKHILADQKKDLYVWRSMVECPQNPLILASGILDLSYFV